MPAGTFIDVGDRDAVRYWCRLLAITPRELRYVVETVGPDADDVKAALMAIAAAPLFGFRVDPTRKP